MIMKETYQEFCKRIMPVVDAGANGGTTQFRTLHGEWFDCDGAFRPGVRYRIKPEVETHVINGFTVPCSIDRPLEKNELYYWVNYGKLFGQIKVIAGNSWIDSQGDRDRLECGNAFRTKEDAMANLKAAMSIDPEYNNDKFDQKHDERWKLVAELLLEDCEILAFEYNALRSELNSRRWDLSGEIDEQTESPKGCEATIASFRAKVDAWKSHITELERMNDLLFNETQRADKLAKRIDEATQFIGETGAIFYDVKRRTYLYEILNGKDGE